MYRVFATVLAGAIAASTWACGARSASEPDVEAGAESADPATQPPLLEGVSIVSEGSATPALPDTRPPDDEPTSRPTAPEGAPCDATTPCAAGEFCRYPIGDCGTPGSSGECTVPPQLCTMQYDPACGCDGVEYGNECQAYASGVSVRVDDTCDGSPPF